MTELDLGVEETESEKKSVSFDFKRFIRKLLVNIHWIILSVLLGWYISKIYLRYQIAIYQVSGSLYIGNGDFNENANNVLKTAGLVDNSTNNINNQIFILRSYNLIGQVVDSLQLDIQLSNNGRIKQQPINLDAFPYDIYFTRGNPQSFKEYTFKTLPASFELINNKDNTTFKGAYGASLVLPDADTVVVIKNKNESKEEQSNTLLLRLQPRDAIISQYQSRFAVASSRQAGEMLELTLTDEYPDRARHFLNTLLYFYNASAIAYKNMAVQKASQFLNGRINEVNKEIDVLENAVKGFKINNKLNNVSEATNLALQQLSTVDAQKSALGFNEEIIGVVELYIKNYSKRDEIVPNQLSISDPVLSGMVAEYNRLLLQKRALKDIGTDKDPILQKVEGQLEELRKNILKNIQNIREQFKVSKQFYATQESKFTKKFESLPDVEKEMVQIERQLAIKQTLYEFLLQKKEEVGVQLASGDISNSRLVDTPRFRGILQPQSKVIYTTGISIGFIFPILILFLLQFLNKKVQSKRDIEALTDIPIVGEIGKINHSEDYDSLFDNPKSRSIVLEQYRTLRSNLYYLGLNDNKRVILVTSFMRDEGKSFTSLNLADVLSQSGKKVVVLEFDLRRPKLSSKIGLPNDNGLSNFMIDQSKKVESLIKKVSSKNDNLYVISSGPIPPNPSELLLQNRMDILFDYLKKEFDYIILDTAPLGLVSDTFSLAKYADITLYIVRHQFSIKQTIEFINELKGKKRLSNIAIVINGIIGSNFDYGYGYGYGYSGTEGYGYSDNVKKKSIFKLFGR